MVSKFNCFEICSRPAAVSMQYVVRLRDAVDSTLASKGDLKMSTSALSDAIYQNTAGNSEGYPLGVPTSWSWYSGTDTVTGNTPPSNFTAVTGWGQVYPESGAPADSNPASVQIANFQTYVHLTSGVWVEVQNQSTDPIDGAHFLADFSGSVAWHETTLSDGSVSVDAPQSGYNDHFWPGARGTYAPGTVDGVFVEASMKTNDPNENLVANLGADWWRDSSAPYVDGFSNNPGVGMSDWVKLTTEWKNSLFHFVQSGEIAGRSTARPGDRFSAGYDSAGYDPAGYDPAGYRRWRQRRGYAVWHWRK